jgi:hypothetical protein
METDAKDLEIARLRGQVEALEKLVALLIPQQPVTFFPMPVQPAQIPHVPPMYPYGPGVQPWDVCAAPPPNLGELWVGDTMVGYAPSLHVGTH